jgi:hypothetical protein
MVRRETMVQGVGGMLLLLCAVAGALPGRPGVVEGAPARGPVREVFFGERQETACQPRGRDFVLEDVRSLWVCVVWSGLAGTYWAQLTFVSPDGHVYQTMTLAFVTPEAPATMATVEVAGRPYAVQRAGWGRPGEAVVMAPLPVAGTYITQHNLAGIWTVKIALNGQPVDWDAFTLLPRK